MLCPVLHPANDLMNGAFHKNHCEHTSLNSTLPLQLNQPDLWPTTSTRPSFIRCCFRHRLITLFPNLLYIKTYRSWNHWELPLTRVKRWQKPFSLVRKTMFSINVLSILRLANVVHSGTADQSDCCITPSLQIRESLVTWSKEARDSKKTKAKTNI